MKRVDAAKITPKDTEIFAPAYMALMLAEAQDDILAYLAIGSFAGVWDSEIRRLQWGDIKREDGEIALAAYKTKTTAARHVKIEPVLAHCLEVFAFEQGPFCKAGFTRRQSSRRSWKSPWRASGAP